MREIVGALALGLIATGLAAVYWPAACVVVGVLLWVDILLDKGRAT